MCGIAFICNYGKRKIPLEFYEKLWCNLSNRGTDASGYYFERKSSDKLLQKMIKGNLPSKELWENIYSDSSKKEFRLNGSESLVFFHCRAQTKGPKENPLNNMPIQSDNFIVIHNGMIMNDHTAKEYKYKAEVDSEEILAQIEMNGIINGLEKLSGSMAIVLKPTKEQRLFLYRNTNPLYLSFIPSKKLLIGISNAMYIPLLADSFKPNKIFKPDAHFLDVTPYTIFEVNLATPKIKELASVSTTITREIPWEK